MGVFDSNIVLFILLTLIGGAAVIVVMFVQAPWFREPQREEPAQEEKIQLPQPKYDGSTSLEKAIYKRRSIRSYSSEPLTLEEVSQLLWAVQGISSPQGFRTAPSAGALYPLEIYVVAGNIINLPKGIYRYEPRGHSLIRIVGGDKRHDLSNAALGQGAITDAPAVFLISALYHRTTGKYGERGVRYVHIEVGHAAQNIYLQAVSLGLGTVIIGAFYDNEIKDVMNMTEKEQPLAIMPMGRPR